MVNVSTPSEIMGSGTKYFGAWIYPRSVGNGFNGRTGIVGPTCCNSSGQHLDLIIGEDQTLAIDSNSGMAWSSIEIPSMSGLWFLLFGIHLLGDTTLVK